MNDVGNDMHGLCRELFPISRSITGNGFRESLSIIARELPGLKTFEVPSGTQCFDWQVPNEWNIKEAYIIDPNGEKICNFSDSNLHVVGYSTPINRTMNLSELNKHLYSLPDQPNAIPYITSYYKERWGFCLTQKQRDALVEGDYQVYIDSELKEGHLTYGELLIPGETKQEIFLSSYLCHPSMANNELSGPVVTTYLAKWLIQRKNRYSYRIVIIPETIGSIVYLSKNLAQMKKNVVAGYNLTCIGDERAYSYLPSRQGDSPADLAAIHTLSHLQPDFIKYSYLDRGSDERQYCSPGVDLPVCSVMRSKYAEYPEYHTSLDDLEFVTPSGLQGGYDAVQKCIEVLENNQCLRVCVKGEPQLGKRGLYPTVSTKNSSQQVRDMMNFLAYADGSLSNLQIADIIGVSLWSLTSTIEKLKEENLLELAGA